MLLFFDRGTGLHTTCRHIDTALSTCPLILHSAYRVKLALTARVIMWLAALTVRTLGTPSDPVTVVMHHNLHTRLITIVQLSLSNLENRKQRFIAG
jgi:hypothetical protein